MTCGGQMTHVYALVQKVPPNGKTEGGLSSFEANFKSTLFPTDPVIGTTVINTH